MPGNDARPGERTPRSFSSVFNSSTPQRPGFIKVDKSQGGRPIGPMTYHLPGLPWLNDPLRPHSTFHSKTKLRQYETPLTAQLDFLGHAGQVSLERAEAPLAHGLRWPDPPEFREVYRDHGLDDFGEYWHNTFAKDCTESSRRYASSFNSTTKRDADVVNNSTPQALGPGAYEVAAATIQIKEPKRMTYSFKSQTDSSSFGTSVVNEPPDMVQSIQSAILSRHWTSKGVPFSTRERFPRERKRWKD